MPIEQVWLVPVAGMFSGTCSVVIPYVIGGALNKTDWLLPYISAGGAFPPESCIFGQLLNITSLIMALCIYLRHRQLVSLYHHTLRRIDNWWRVFSLIGMFIGFIAAFFCSMVANFQETSVLSVHIVSALIAFGGALIYMWIQTIFTFIMKPRLHGLWFCFVRLAICVLGVPTFLAINLGSVIDPPSEETEKLPIPVRWSPDMQGYAGHLVDTFGEWIYAFLIFIYLLSFAVELRSCTLCAPKLELKAHVLNKFGASDPDRWLVPDEQRSNAPDTVQHI